MLFTCGLLRRQLFCMLENVAIECFSPVDSGSQSESACTSGCTESAGASDVTRSACTSPTSPGGVWSFSVPCVLSFPLFFFLCGPAVPFESSLPLDRPVPLPMLASASGGKIASVSLMVGIFLCGKGEVLLSRGGLLSCRGCGGNRWSPSSSFCWLVLRGFKTFAGTGTGGGTGGLRGFETFAGTGTGGGSGSMAESS